MHRLILVGGGAPGLGKSTLADFLYRQLRQRGCAVQWLYEEDAAWLPAMRRFNALWPIGDPEAIDELLRAATTLSDEWAGDGAVHIVDSFLPGFFLVAGRYPEERVRRFVRELRQVTARLDPLLVYLTGDIRGAWERAVAQRGTAWGEQGVPYVAGWPKPEYPYGPIRTADDVVVYFEWIDQRSRNLFDAWGDDVLILDSAQSLECLESALLTRLGLERVPGPTPVADLTDYTGTYTAARDDGEETLTVTIEDGALHVDSYWPDGCRLVPEGLDCFRLQATSRSIRFQRDGEGRITGLRYLVRQREQTYRLSV